MFLGILSLQKKKESFKGNVSPEDRDTVVPVRQGEPAICCSHGHVNSSFSAAKFSVPDIMLWCHYYSRANINQRKRHVRKQRCMIIRLIFNESLWHSCSCLQHLPFTPCPAASRASWATTTSWNMFSAKSTKLTTPKFSDLKTSWCSGSEIWGEHSMTGLSFPTGVWGLYEKMERLRLLPVVPTHASGKPDPYKGPHCTISKSSHKLSSTTWPSEGSQDPTTHCGLEQSWCPRFKGESHFS